MTTGPVDIPIPEVIRSVSPVAAVPTSPPGIRLVNESALGLYLVSWTSSDGVRCEVMWSEGMDAPMVSRLIPAQGRMSPGRPLANPDRFGWKRPRRPADFMAFARRFSDATERD